MDKQGQTDRGLSPHLKLDGDFSRARNFELASSRTGGGGREGGNRREPSICSSTGVNEKTSSDEEHLGIFDVRQTASKEGGCRPVGRSVGGNEELYR